MRHKSPYDSGPRLMDLIDAVVMDYILGKRESCCILSLSILLLYILLTFSSWAIFSVSARSNFISSDLASDYSNELYSR